MAAIYVEERSRLPGAVVWTTLADDEPTRVLPDGCLDLLWLDGVLQVAGPDTRAQIVTSEAGAVGAGLRFAPGFGPRVVGVPARELRDQRVPLADIWAADTVRAMEDRLAAADRPGAELEAVALSCLRPPEPRHALVDAVVDQVRAGSSVSAVADSLGLSARQLHRLCLDAFGYGPKLLGRILRMQRSLALARSGVAFAETAARSGYADQAHLARDVRDLAGVPLGELVR